MSGIGAFTNAIRMQAMLAGNGRADARYGTVTSYDPAKYSVKVMLEPEGFETGWLPMASAAVGDGWGLHFGPAVGQMVLVAFAGGSKDNGVVLGSFFNDSEVPVGVPSGEQLLRHRSGTLLHFDNSGNMTLASEQNTVQTVGGSLTVTARDNITITASGGKASVTDGESTIALNGDGTVSMTVPGKITIEAPNAEFTGNVSVDAALSFGSISGGSF